MIRNRLADAEARSALASAQLQEARRRKAAELEPGQETLSQLSTTLSARHEELRNLEEVVEGEQQERASLRADVAKLAEVRDRRQRLIVALSKQVGR